MKKNFIRWVWAIFCIALGSALSVNQACAQNTVQSEDSFREVFLTAGYSAAFGAALGVAILPFFPDSPVHNLRYVASGASVGFIIGSAFAFYNISNNLGHNSFSRDPSENPDGDDADQGYGSLPEIKPTLPAGALVVGLNNTFAFSVPAIRLGKNQVEMQIFQLEF